MTAAATDIDQRIWQVVAMIPAGKVATYGDIARQAGLPGAARRVGRALRGLPGDTRIPWHRVINAQGRLSLPAGSPARNLQRDRLQAEGIAFGAGARVDLHRHRWWPGQVGGAAGTGPRLEKPRGSVRMRRPVTGSDGNTP